MSRRPNPGADRAAQNAQTLKALLKLEGNKVCADCKRNKHPRWASWNLGVFFCIRCSGIHRGMGTHISRVKSVDLDAWTDEQLQSVLKWGNARANKYWEAKLAPGHVPSEAKIENFIRTKYESKRWVMDGPMPDPSTLDTEGDDDLPLNLVQEKAKIERSASQRAQPASRQQQMPAASRPAPSVDLFSDFTPAPPARPSTADIPDIRSARSGPPPAVRSGKPQDSLLGLDFFGAPPSSGAGRPSSASSNPVSSSNARGDLKHSILSLYANIPKPQPPPQPAHETQPSFGGMSSNQDALGGLSDAFGGLSFPSHAATKSPPIQQSPSFAAISAFPAQQPTKAATAAPQVTSPPPLSGGSFFDTGPPKPAAPKQSPAVNRPVSNGLDFAFASKPQPAASPPSRAMPTSIPTDLFASDDFNGFASAPAAGPAPPQPKMSSPGIGSSSDFSSAFNLTSAAAPAPKAAALSAHSVTTAPTNSSMFDPWGSGNDSNAWGAPEPAAATKPAPRTVDLGKPPARITPNDISGGWGAPISSATKSMSSPTVTADEDFGGWTSAAPAQSPVATTTKQGGGFGTAAANPFDDNPWG